MERRAGRGSLQRVAELVEDHATQRRPRSRQALLHCVFAQVEEGRDLHHRLSLTVEEDAAAAARNRWEFMVTIAPLPIPNGTGSPVSPITMF